MITINNFQENINRVPNSMISDAEIIAEALKKGLHKSNTKINAIVLKFIELVNLNLETKPKTIKKPHVVKLKPIVKEKNNSVLNIAIDSINLDKSRFQNRNKLNEEVLKNIINNFNFDKLDAVIVWTDPNDGLTYLLAGHHRLEATKRAGYKTIPAKFFKGSEEEAIKYAKVESNSNRSLETPIERAKIYREMYKNGSSKKEIQETADKNENKNASFILNLSFLKENGIVLQSLEALESSDKQNINEIEKIADWIGSARRNANQLTDAHEKEMFDFLKDKSESLRIKSKTEFLHKINSIVSAIDFDKNKPLNLKRFKYQTAGEEAYNNEYKELENSIQNLVEKKEKMIDRLKNPKSENYINPNDKDYMQVLNEMDKQTQLINEEIKALQFKINNLRSNKSKITNAGSNQNSLFGINKNSLAQKLANRQTEFDYFEIANNDIAEFLGNIEKKERESIVISLTGGQGSMKTRFAFQFMNALAQNYRVGHASIEEHPESKLYFDKVEQYLNETAIENIEAPEVQSMEQLELLIKNNDVIIIDSFAKMQEIEKGFEVDKDLRKKYNGKLFLVIFQQTSDGKMRGGSKSQFDADIVLFTQKEQDYRNNYVWADKNRYQDKPLDQLKFNIYNGKMVVPEQEENNEETETINSHVFSFNVQ